VRLATECSLSNVDGGQKSRRVRRVLKGVKAKCSVSVGEIQFSWGIEGEVMAHDSIDLLTHRLDCNYKVLIAFYSYLQTRLAYKVAISAPPEKSIRLCWGS